MKIHLCDNTGIIRHEFEVTGELQTLQQSAKAATAVIAYRGTHYYFGYTNAGGGGFTFFEAELVEIVDKDAESMSPEEMRGLTPGDLVRHQGDPRVYVVHGNYGDRVTAARTVDLTNPSEWVLVKKGVQS